MDVVSLERSLLAAQLGGLAEHAHYAGVKLWVEAVNRDETHLLNRLAQAASLVAPLAHPSLGIVADLFHMAREESDAPGAILEHASLIGHVHLADSNRGLPGSGSTDFKPLLGAFSKIGYSGWLVLECDQPGNNLGRANWNMEHLPESLAMIRGAFA